MYKIFRTLLWAILLGICSCTHDSLFDPVDAPSNLTYSPDSIAVQSGQVASSATPTLLGSRPFAFNLNTIPANGGTITIDEAGVIHVGSQAAAGKYSATVVVINAAGSVSFPNIYKIRVYDPPQPPSDLLYTPDSVNIHAGSNFTSNRPGVNGTRPFTFTIIGNPEPDNISIDNRGIVSTSAALPVGTYPLTIQVANTEGSETFISALTLNVTDVDQAPSALSYSMNSMALDSGTTASSVTPTLSGTAPFTFSLTSSPDAGAAITIDNFGIITAGPPLVPGVYTIDIQVTNSAGTTSFPGAYTITINEVIPVTFTNDVLPLINQYCSTCHTTGPKTIYSDYNNAARDINLILDRVQRKPGSAGFMPKNGKPLTADQIQLLKDWLAHGLLE